jgi:hypothetical protein
MMMDMIEKYFWLICLVFLAVNAGIWRWRSRRHIARDPSLAEGYRRLIKGMVKYGSIPFVIMGLGALSGGAPSIRDYFRPQDMNPYVLAFFGSAVLLWILGSWWLFARGGAETMVRHPGLIEPHINSPRLLKALWVLGMLGGIFAMISMFRADIPVG